MKEISKTERVSGVREEWPEKQPDSNQEAVDRAKFHKKLKEENARKKRKDKEEKPSGEKEKGTSKSQDPNLGDQIDFQG